MRSRGPGLRCRGGGLAKGPGHGTETVFDGAGPGAMRVNILSIAAKDGATSHGDARPRLPRGGSSSMAT